MTISELCKEFDLKAIHVSNPMFNYSGRESVELGDFVSATCLAQCSGGGFDTYDALKMELQRMLAAGATESEVVAQCTGTKPTSTEHTQTCLGSVKADVVIVVV